jgi:hypothetical protein
MFKYNQAYNYFQKTLTALNAKHILFLSVTTKQYLKQLRVRKARIFILIIDSIASQPNKIVAQIFSNATQVPVEKIIDHTSMLAKKYTQERAFVGQCIHLLASISVASCTHKIWLYGIQEIISIVNSRDDMSVSEIDNSLTAEYKRLKKEFSRKSTRLDEMILYKQKGDFTTLEDESDRALEEFVLEFKNLKIEIPKLKEEEVKLEEQMFQMLILLQIYSSSLLRIFEGKTPQGYIIKASSKFYIDTDTKNVDTDSKNATVIFDNVFISLKNLIEFYTSPPAFSTIINTSTNDNNFSNNNNNNKKGRNQLFETITINALKSIDKMINNDVKKVTGFKNCQNDVFKMIRDYLKRNNISYPRHQENYLKRTDTLMKSTVTLQLLYTLKTLSICRYAYRVEAVCKGEIKAQNIYQHESKIRTMSQKKRIKKEKSLEEILHRQILQDHDEDIFYYHLVKDSILWENPYSKNNVQKRHVQNYENIEIKPWNLDFYMKIYEDTKMRNSNLYVKIFRKDLLYFLNQDGFQNNQRIDDVKAERGKYISYTNACNVLSRGIRRHQASKQVQKLKDIVRMKKGMYLLPCDFIANCPINIHLN